MAKQKEKEELHPQIKKIEDGDFSPETFFNDKDINKKIVNKNKRILNLKDLEDFVNLKDESGNDADTYFKKVLEEFMSEKNISLKTEYTSVDEQFTATKLGYMINEGGFKFMQVFLPFWKRDRVSLLRKAREEIVMALWERQKERMAQEEKQKAKQDNGLGM